MYSLILVISLIASCIEYASLKKSGNLRDLAVSAGFLCLGIVLTCLRIAGVKLPSPMVIVRLISQPIGDMVSHLLS